MGRQLKNKYKIKLHSLNKPLLIAVGATGNLFPFKIYLDEKSMDFAFFPLCFIPLELFLCHGHNQAGYNNSFKRRPRHIPPPISKALFSKDRLLLDTTGTWLTR